MSLLQSKTRLDKRNINPPSLRQRSDDVMELHGDLTLDNSHTLLQPGLAAIASKARAGGQQWSIDCCHIGAVSSAAVALMLQWWRACQVNNLQFRLENLPQQLLPLMTISEVEPLLAECIASVKQ